MEELQVEPAKKRERLKVVLDGHCVNADCPVAPPGGDNASSGQLRSASTFERAFYGAKDGDGRRICEGCAERSGSSLRGVRDRIREGQPALRGLEAFTPQKDMVTLDDSDEDKDDREGSSKEESEESEFEMDVTEVEGGGDTAKGKFKHLIDTILGDFRMTEQVGRLRMITFERMS